MKELHTTVTKKRKMSVLHLEVVWLVVNLAIVQVKEVEFQVFLLSTLESLK
jgi:hypothetical protein